MYEDLVVDGRLLLENVNDFTNFSVIPRGIRELNIDWCIGPTSLVGLPESLQSLTIKSCYDLVSLGRLPPSLQTLTIEWCHELTSLEGLPESLQTLVIRRSMSLTSLEGVQEGLQSLTISGCRNLSALPLLPNLQELDFDRPLEVYGEPVQTLEAYQAVCCAYTRKKSAYA